MRRHTLLALSAMLALAMPSRAMPRQPFGLYAKVDPSDVIQSRPRADWTDYLACLYRNLLEDPAISGLTLQLHWDLLNPEPDTYRFDYLETAFDVTRDWNRRHPASEPKTIQLIVTSGFNSPGWVLDPAYIPSCDDLFTTGKARPDCGTVTFTGFQENADGNVLPLPWNRTYRKAWHGFVGQLAAQFGSRRELVSIEVGGPGAASDELIMPSDGDADNPQPNGLSPDAMWNQLFEHFNLPQNSDEAFVEAWKDAIRFYEKTFSGLTLIVTPGDGQGFPNYRPFEKPDDAFFKDNCSQQPSMSCGASVEIVSFFKSQKPPSKQEPNGKATQVSGLTGSLETLDTGTMGIAGVKLLAQETEEKFPDGEVLGGAQFDHAFFNCPDGKLCQGDPEQTESAVLATFFNGTSAAKAFCQATIDPKVKGPAPLNYLQLYDQDVLYAEQNVCRTEALSCAGQVSAQDLLNLASASLAAIAEPARSPSSTLSCSPDFPQPRVCQLPSCAPPLPEPPCITCPSGAKICGVWDAQYCTYQFAECP